MILNLTIWFALHVVFTEVTRQTLGPLLIWQAAIASANLNVLVLAILSGVLLFRLGWSVPAVLGASAAGALLLSVW